MTENVNSECTNMGRLRQKSDFPVQVRVRIADGQSVGIWLSSLQNVHAATNEHDYVPLASIQGPGILLFDTLLVVENLARLETIWFRTAEDGHRRQV